MKYDWKIKTVDLNSAVKKEKIHLQRLKKSDDVDREELNARIEALYFAKAEYQKSKYGFKLDVKEVLSETQIDSLKSIKKR